MEFARDLASADLWADSLERSLSSRGRPRRASLALGRLTAERDLADPNNVGDSIVYWRGRRAASADTGFTAPAVGGASVLALLARRRSPPSLAAAPGRAAPRGPSSPGRRRRHARPLGPSVALSPLAPSAAPAIRHRPPGRPFNPDLRPATGPRRSSRPRPRRATARRISSSTHGTLAATATSSSPPMATSACP